MMPSNPMNKKENRKQNPLTTKNRSGQTTTQLKMDIRNKTINLWIKPSEISKVKTQQDL